MQTKKVAVVGAGISGLAGAIRLAAKGYAVTVYDKNPASGGKMDTFTREGFRFDTGPSLFTMPGLLVDVLRLAGPRFADSFHFTRLSSACLYFFEDGTVINAYTDPEHFALEAHRATGEPVDVMLSYLYRARQLYDLSADVFLYNSFHKLSNFARPEFRKTGRNIGRLDFFTSMHSRNRKCLNSPHLVQIFDRFATYNGSNPYKAPATLNMISHLEHNIGAFFPEHGMYQIAASLEEAARSLGVEFSFGSRVQRIEMKNHICQGIVAGDTFQPADIVYSDADILTVYNRLLRGGKLPLSQKISERSTSALIFYWGINRSFPELGLHNILFSADYPHEFNALFRSKIISSDPTVYLFISSKAVPTDAPSDCENWFVMINAPENIGQDWAVMIQEARSGIVAKINRMLKTDIEKHILFEERYDPQRIEEKTLSPGGSLYGNSSNSRLSAFLRHPNFRRKYKGLFFAGGSVHPGGGIPLCLCSALIVDKEIPSTLNRHRV